MQVKILGSAAGGAFPQWNCACPNCHAVRGGQFQGKARSQTQVAVSADGESWSLLGASPDLRLQIEATAELHPRSGVRSSPIQDVVLISADLDHVLGLLLMRELQPYRVHAAEPIIKILSENAMFGMLNRVPDQVQWQTIRAGEAFDLVLTGQSVPPPPRDLSSRAGRGIGSAPGKMQIPRCVRDDSSKTESSLGGSSKKDEGNSRRITCMPVALSSHYPAYVSQTESSQEAVLGLILTSSSGATLGFFPQLAQLTPELKNVFSSLDCLLLDGTFWSDDELIRLQGSTQRARDMGHVPVGGADGTLQQLAGLTKPRKIYIHINNTNPMLNEAGAEYRAVRDAGWELAEDGCHFTL
jgi:pyrroloquinoline quinone biosynthesis protein B